MMSHKELEGKTVEHPEKGRGVAFSDERLYPQLLVRLEEDGKGCPVIDPTDMESNDWEVVDTSENIAGKEGGSAE